MNWTDQLASRLQRLATREELEFQDTPRPLRDSYLRQHAVVEGCRKEEIAGLEREFGRFPGEYRDYLKTFGRRAATLFEDSDAAFSLLPALQLEFVEALEEAAPSFSPPRCAFVIRARRADEFWWIVADGERDPRVHHWRMWEPAERATTSSIQRWVARTCATLEERERTANSGRLSIRRDPSGKLQIERRAG